MDKKDYKLIANTIKKCLEHYNEPSKDIISATLECLSFELSEVLLTDNPKFSTNKFMTACGFSVTA